MLYLKNIVQFALLFFIFIATIADESYSFDKDKISQKKYVQKLIRNLPKKTGLYIFHLEKNKVKPASQTERKTFHKQKKKITIFGVSSDINKKGDGYLVINSDSDNLLCQIKNSNFKSCYIQMKLNNETTKCSARSYSPDNKANHDVLICTKQTLSGTGVSGKGEAFFLMNKISGFSYMGFLPTDEYYTVIDNINGIIRLKSENLARRIDGEIVIDKCTSINFEPFEGKNETKILRCGHYVFDFRQERIRHSSGPNALGRPLLSDAYGDESEHFRHELVRKKNKKTRSVISSNNPFLNPTASTKEREVEKEKVIKKENKILTDIGSVSEAQLLLYDLNWDVGDVDGVMGKRTRKAIRAVQNQLGLPVTGKITEDFLARLRRSKKPNIWGAVAFQAEGIFGGAWSASTRREASNAAISGCLKAKGLRPSDCKKTVISFFADNCVGLAFFQRGRRYGTYPSHGRSPAMARKNTLVGCRTKNRTRCKMVGLICANGRHQ